MKENDSYSIVDEYIKQLECNERILSYHFDYDNILFWPFVRYKILSKLLNTEMNLSDPHARVEKLSLIDIIKFIYRIFLLKPKYREKHKDIIIFSSNILNIQNSKNEYFNRIHDYFAELYSNSTVIFESSARRKFRFPRNFHEIRSIDIYKTISKLVSYFLLPQKNDIKNINAFLQHLKNILPSYLTDEFFREILDILLQLSKSLKYYKKNMLKLFGKIKPKIILLHCASYGNESYIIKWAKEEGIITAEIQHGVVSNTHMAYNYGESIRKSKEYNKYIPEYILTYGSFWNVLMNISSKKIVVGSPHFTIKLEEYLKGKNEYSNRDKKNVLFISQGIFTKTMVDLAKNLLDQELNDEYQIVFRLHPGEIPFKDRYSVLYQYSKILVDHESDIFDLIASCDILVGIYSTTIFEAIPFNKPIFILDNEMSRLHIPGEIGERFKTAEDLAILLNKAFSNPEKYLTNYKEKIWNNNWEDKYREFIDSIIG